MLLKNYCVIQPLVLNIVLPYRTIQIQTLYPWFRGAYSQSAALSNAGRNLRCMRLCTSRSAEPSTLPVADGTARLLCLERSDVSSPLPFSGRETGSLLVCSYAQLVPGLIQPRSRQLPASPVHQPAVGVLDMFFR